MKNFHLSDVVSVTTGRLLSSRGMDGINDVLDFLTGDKILVHQIPRISHEIKPWIHTQYPALMQDAPGMPELLHELDKTLDAAGTQREQINAACAEFIERVRAANGLPETLPLYEIGADMHTDRSG